MTETDTDAIKADHGWNERVRRTCWLLRHVERMAGLVPPEEREATLDWPARLDRIISAAIGAKLDADVYAWCWRFRTGLREVLHG